MVKKLLWDKEVDIDIASDVFPTDEQIQAREATLPECRHGWFTSTYQKKSLHYRVFLPKSPPKGIIVFQHGIQGMSGRSFVLKDGSKVAMGFLAEMLLQQGYALYGLDMLGHGWSEGKRFYVPDWKVNRDDLEAFGQFVSQQHSQTPLFLMGESYGGNLALHVAGMWEDSDVAPKNYVGFVLNAPAVIGDLPPYPVVFILRYMLAPVFPTWTPFFMPNPVSADRIWSDPEVRECFTDPAYAKMCLEGCARPFRLGTAKNMLGALESVQTDVIPHLTKPYCVCHGTDDMAVLKEGTEFLVKHAKTPESDRMVLFQEGAYHDLFSEPTRENTLEFILKFLNEYSHQYNQETTKE